MTWRSHQMLIGRRTKSCQLHWKYHRRVSWLIICSEILHTLTASQKSNAPLTNEPPAVYSTIITFAWPMDTSTTSSSILPKVDATLLICQDTATSIAIDEMKQDASESDDSAYEVTLEARDDPQRMSKGRKWCIVLTICSGAVCATCASTMVCSNIHDVLSYAHLRTGLFCRE